MTEDTGLTAAVANAPRSSAQSVGRGEKLPGGNAGGAGNDQLGGSGQAPEAQDAAEQYGERQDLHCDVGQAQRRDFAHQGEGRVGLGGGAAQQFDEVEHRDQAAERTQHCDHRAGELSGDVDREGDRGRHSLRPVRWPAATAAAGAGQAAASHRSRRAPAPGARPAGATHCRARRGFPLPTRWQAAPPPCPRRQAA